VCGTVVVTSNLQSFFCFFFVHKKEDSLTSFPTQSTPDGSILRLLALVALMAQAAWLRDWFEISRGGAILKPALLQAAALSPLTQSGGFDETALRALLPHTS